MNEDEVRSHNTEAARVVLHLQQYSQQEVQLELQQGCYPGCFYYTDSCFRSDCKKNKE